MVLDLAFFSWCVFFAENWRFFVWFRSRFPIFSGVLHDFIHWSGYALYLNLIKKSYSAAWYSAFAGKRFLILGFCFWQGKSWFVSSKWLGWAGAVCLVDNGLFGFRHWVPCDHLIRNWCDKGLRFRWTNLWGCIEHGAFVTVVQRRIFKRKE